MTPEDRFAAEDRSEAGIEQSIRRLLESQPYAVLCTQGHGQPYGSLIAFAATGDLTHVVFATPKATRKFRLLSECDHAALVVGPGKVEVGWTAFAALLAYGAVGSAVTGDFWMSYCPPKAYWAPDGVW